MAVNNVRVQPGYSLNQPLTNIPYNAIVSQRAPASTDKAPIGQIWIDVPNNDAYVLTSIVANSASWINMAGGSGSFNSLSVTTTITAGTNITSTAGNIAATAGTVTGGTGLVATTGGVTASAGNIVATLGNISATAGSVTAGTTVTATLGNITATNGDFVASTAGKGVTLGGGAKIVCGSGDPNTVVTAAKGSLYLNLTGSGAADRAWINTDGATAWTNLVTAA